MGASGDDLIVQVAIAMITVPTIAVGIRFWSRGLAQRGRYSLDDWLALAAWVSSIFH